MICIAVLALDFIITSASIGLYSHSVEQDCFDYANGYHLSVCRKISRAAAETGQSGGGTVDTNDGMATAQDLPPSWLALGRPPHTCWLLAVAAPCRVCRIESCSEAH